MDTEQALLTDPTPHDLASGVPTCNKCGMKFTTWHRFKHHIQFVCYAPVEGDDDLEHRLRVQEFLHLARGLNLAVLCQRADLCAHFTQRCILCGRFTSSIKGLLQHWNDFSHTFFPSTWNLVRCTAPTPESTISLCFVRDCFQRDSQMHCAQTVCHVHDQHGRTGTTAISGLTDHLLPVTSAARCT